MSQQKDLPEPGTAKGMTKKTFFLALVIPVSCCLPPSFVSSSTF